MTQKLFIVEDSDGDGRDNDMSTGEAGGRWG